MPPGAQWDTYGQQQLVWVAHANAVSKSANTLGEHLSKNESKNENTLCKTIDIARELRTPLAVPEGRCVRKTQQCD